MTREQLTYWAQEVEDIMVKRRKLGGFDTNAADTLRLCEAIWELYRHEIDKKPLPKRA